MFLDKKEGVNYTANPLRKQSIPNYISKELSKYSLTNNQLFSLPYLACDANMDEYLKYFNNCWLLTESLFSALKYEESFYLKPYHKLRHPALFYYGHVATFYINKMLVSGLITKTIDKHLEDIFETGVDEMSWDVNTKKNEIKWPNLHEVISYRIKAYDLIIKTIRANKALFESKIDPKSPIWSLLMSFEHERIHFETSSVLIRELDIEHVAKPALLKDIKIVKDISNSPKLDIDYPANNFLTIKGDKITIRKDDLNSFGWDNEFGQKEYNIPEFQVNNFLISNGEFFEFVKDGGYHEDSYWCAQGLAWRKFSNISKPTFWYADGPKGSNLFKLRTCFEIVEMQWRFPVIVNHFEAKAFCAYKAKKEGQYYRLLTEAEHRLLSKDERDNVKEQEHHNYNYNLKLSSESAVDEHKSKTAPIYDLHGNIWQWLEDNFHPLTDFKIHEYYPDFSTPCFDDEHKMIAGSSFFSTGNLASIYSRYHFRPHFFQHAGFRLVTSTYKKEYFPVKVEFETVNPNNGKLYIIFTENHKLNILEKDMFNKKYTMLKK